MAGKPGKGKPRRAKSTSTREEEDRDAVERYRALFDRSLECVYVHDLEGRFLDANQAGLRLLGYERSEIPSLSLSDVMDPDQLEEAHRAVEDLLRSGVQTRTVEIRLRRKNGEPVDVEAEASLIQRGGRPFAIQGIARDITKRKSTQEALRRETIFTSAVLDSVPGLLYLYDETGYLRRWNRKHEEMTGYTADELTRMHILDWFKGDEEATLRIEDGVRRTMSEGHGTAEADLRTKSGAKIPFYFTGVRLMIDGKPYLIGIGIDITERKRAEASLRDSEETLRVFLDALPEPAYLVDSGGIILVVNQAMAASLGKSVDEILGRCAFDFLPSPIAEARRAQVARVIATGEPMVFEDSRDGRYFMNYSYPVRDTAGRVTKVAMLGLDITVRKALEDQLRQAQKLEAVGRLAGGVAHDFNNMLTAIIGFCEISGAAIGDQAPALEKNLDEIRKAADHAASLTRQLLAFGRQQILQPRVLSLNSLLKELTGMLRRLIGEDIALEIVLHPDAWSVKADPVQIEQVIVNLAVNARDAMPDGGAMTIATANAALDADYSERHVGVKPGDYVVLRISDSGCGIDEGTKARLFEPFFTTKEMGRGTGLGLSIVYGIVEQSGGHLTVESEVGVGTTFRIYLPRAVSAPEPIAARAKPGGHALGGTETILVAEDDDGIRQLLVDVLRSNGYEVLAAPNGTEALDLAEARRGEIDLLITDVVMPGLGGRQLAERLTVSSPGLKVLYISGYTDDELFRRGVPSTGVNFLQKPFGMNDLLVRAREILAGDGTARGPDS